MPKSPTISAVFAKEHRGEVAISLRGKVIATGNNSVLAFKNAKKVIPEIDKQEFVVTRIYYKHIAI